MSLTVYLNLNLVINGIDVILIYVSFITASKSLKKYIYLFEYPHCSNL